VFDRLKVVPIATKNKPIASKPSPNLKKVVQIQARRETEKAEPKL
jgi:hypothetical protein